jgi:hypothetical protein
MHVLVAELQNRLWRLTRINGANKKDPYQQFVCIKTTSWCDRPDMPHRWEIATEVFRRITRDKTTPNS